jgi:type IV pilus assembly protein PilC
MTGFSYKAIDENGMGVTGVIDADSIVIAKNLISERGHIPTKIKEVSNVSISDIWYQFLARAGAVKTSELVLFTKQFRNMLRAGVPIVRLLKVLELQTQNRTLRRITRVMLKKVKQGASLTDCVEEYPTVFSPLYCAMVKAGEISGSLPDVLKRLIYVIDHEKKVKSDLNAAIRYPMLVLFTLAVAFFVLLTYVMPKFAKLFENANVDLPLPTRITIGLHGFFADYWYFVVGGIAALVAIISYLLRTEEGIYFRDNVFLRIPIIGPLYIKVAMARFTSIFAILHASGIRIMDSMNILSGTIGNTAISRTFDEIRERVKEGEGISGPLKSAKHFPPMVSDMIAIGEESGNLEEMLQDITDHYDDEVEYHVKGLEQVIGPILIVLLAAMVGFFALSIFLPIWEMTKLATD